MSLIYALSDFISFIHVLKEKIIIFPYEHL